SWTYDKRIRPVVLKSTEAGGSGNCQIPCMVSQRGRPQRDWLPKRGSPSGEGLRVLIRLNPELRDAAVRRDVPVVGVAGDRTRPRDGVRGNGPGSKGSAACTRRQLQLNALGHGCVCHINDAGGGIDRDTLHVRGARG